MALSGVLNLVKIIINPLTSFFYLECLGFACVCFLGLLEVNVTYMITRE